MVLNLDRNTRTAKGHYFVTTFYRNGKLPDEKNYKIEMKNNKIILLDEVKDDKLKQIIENFKFFGQYANLKELKNIIMVMFQLMKMFLVMMLNTK